MTRYLPPHLRDKLSHAGEAAANGEARGLDGLQQPYEAKVKLVFPGAVEFDAAACPLDLEAAATNGAAFTGCKTVTIHYPEKLPDELLDWFKSTFEEHIARLEFPPELSKLERAKWHSMAHRKGLRTESQGVGDARFISILSAKAAEESEAAATAEKPHLNRSQRHRAQQIYDFCQLEGGRFWDYSKGELEDMVASAQPLPADLAEMVGRRERGAKVNQLLRQGEPAEALQMLFDEPRLAWQKDEHSGGYPVHLATWKGYKSVVQYLVSLPNVIEQRDGQRETPLAVAIRRGNREMEQLLLEGGADLSHANYHRELAARSGNSSSEEEQEYISWNRAERRAYKHGGEGGPGRRRSMDNGGRRSVDMGRRSLDMARLSLDGKAAPPAPGSTGSVGGSRKPGSRRQSVDLPATSHCPW